MITREQAVRTAHRWINGELPDEAARAVRSHEFEQGWVVWPEPSPVQVDPLTGARRAPEEIGAACGVVDRVTGELTVWPSVPVATVVRRYRDRLGAGGFDPVLPPVTGPGVRATLVHRDAEGAEHTLVVDSAHGLAHPLLRGWQQLRRQGVQPADLVSLHCDLRPGMLPGGYWAYVLGVQLPDTPIGYDHANGPWFDHRAEGARAAAAGPARAGAPRPNRVPFPVAVPPAVPEPAADLAARLASVFGAEGVRRFEPAAVLAADLPESVARLLTEVGLPRVVEGFFALHHPEPDGIADGGRTAPVLPELTGWLAGLGRGARATAAARQGLLGQVLIGTDGWALITVDTAQGRVRAVDPDLATARYCNADLTAFTRCLALLADRLPRLRGLDAQSAGPAVAEFQWALATLDRTVFDDPENWWSVIVEQLWHGQL
ncbi:SUKH-4 family immunity protein [Kitasatospora sp. NPDC048540]|uniref:SUKH-4 family immunity protein n=1 Tax=Kitasatospora sp. NPDC048540 TaxID=3155634 RepID=UPI003403B476